MKCFSRQVTINQQESLLQAVSLVPTTIDTTKCSTNNENTTLGLLDKQIETNNQQSTVNTAIPQELTSMSDNDLISYINPSCFDQGEIINYIIMTLELFY